MSGEHARLGFRIECFPGGGSMSEAVLTLSKSRAQQDAGGLDHRGSHLSIREILNVIAQMTKWKGALSSAQLAWKTENEKNKT